MPAKGQDTWQTSIFLAKLIGPLFARARPRPAVQPRRGSRRARRVHPQPRDPVPLRPDHLAGRPRDRADPQCVGRGLARHSSRMLGWLTAISGAIRLLAPQGADQVRPPRPTNSRTAPCSAPRSGSRSAPSSASSATSNNQPARENTHEQARLARRSRHPEGHDRADLPARARSTPAPDAAPDLRVPMREIVLDPSSGEPPVPVYDPSGPYTDDNVAIDVERGLKRTRVEWVRERGGVEEYEGRPIKPVDNGNVTRQAPRAQLPEHAEADARRRRRAGHPIRIRAARHHHQGDDLRRRAREPRPQDRCWSARSRRSPTARASAPRCPPS